MSSSLAELSDGAALQPFVAMGRSLKDFAALAGLIKQVISAPSVYVFGELLALENVKAMAAGDDNAKAHYKLLDIFAYGTYATYKEYEDRLPKLTKPQEIKLKQLTIVNLASLNRVIPYKTLQEQLDVANVRELEDLIIDSIYQGLLTGKLDQQKSIFLVDETFGRDVRIEQDASEMIKTLDSWVSRSDSLLKTIEERITWANKEAEAAKKHSDEFKKKLDDIKATVKASVDADIAEGGASGMGGNFMDYDMEDKRRGKLRGHGKNKMGGGPRDRNDMIAMGLSQFTGGPGGFDMHGPGHGGPRDPRHHQGGPRDPRDGGRRFPGRNM